MAENEKCVFGAPDGGEKPNDTAQARTRELAATDCHQNNMFFITKYHKGMNKTEVIDFKGNVQDCTAIELDDMTDTGGTLVNGAFTLKENGAKRVIAAVTHGIFSGKSLKNLTSDTIGDQENPIDLLLTTDSILGVYGKIRSLNARQKQRIVVIPTLPLIKAALKCT